MTQDDMRANFLLALDRADVNVSAFEGEFIESNLARFSFSPKQRTVIDKLMDKYAVAINFDPDRPKLAERAAKEEAAWNRDPKRMIAKAPRPTIKEAGQYGWKQFAQQMPSNKFAARPRAPRPTAHIKEKLRRNSSIPEWRLSWFPVKPGTVKRNGARLEEWFIDYATGVLHDCPFLEDGDEFEYEHYTNIHG